MICFAQKNIVSLVIFFFIFTSSVVSASDEIVLHVGIASNFSEVSNTSVNPFEDGFRAGIELARADAMVFLKEKGINIDLVEFDYGSNALNAIETAKDAISSDVSVVIGYNASTEALLVAPNYQKNKLPLIITTATATRLGQIGEYIFPLAVNNSLMAKYMIQTLAGMNKSKIVIIDNVDCAYCTDLTNNLINEIKSSNNAILVSRFSILTNTSNEELDNVILELKKLNFDSVVLPNHEKSTSLIISELKKNGIDTVYIGGDGWENADMKIINKVSKNTESYFITDWHEDMPNSYSREFVKKYKARYGSIPNDDAVLAYDSFMFLVEALKLDTTEGYTRESLKNALNRIKSFDSLSGKMNFISNGKIYKPAVLLGRKKNESTFSYYKTTSI